jgi:hypothetical protein
MNQDTLKYFDLLEAKKAYAEGKNVTELLRNQKNAAANTSEIIEAAYDLQAGAYIAAAQNNPNLIRYCNEIAAILDRHVIQTGSLLDIGTGELTTLSHMIAALNVKPKSIYAFDISWSRVHKGIAYAEKNMGSDYHKLTSFVGDINEIPLLDKSVNVTTSSHALEPNGGRLKQLMAELFRVTIDKLVLFEPCYEINTDAGKERMDWLGYIKNLDGVIAELGGKIIERITIRNIVNPLNPTACFVILPPPSVSQKPVKDASPEGIFSVPGAHYPLKKVDDFFFSQETGLCFPVLKNVPVLKTQTAILASALCD